LRHRTPVRIAVNNHNARVGDEVAGLSVGLQVLADFDVFGHLDILTSIMARLILQCLPIDTLECRMEFSTRRAGVTRTPAERTQLITLPPEMIATCDTSRIERDARAAALIGENELGRRKAGGARAKRPNS